MNKLQNALYNNGERLVPYVSHDESELIRHRSSYAFFYNVIAKDTREINKDTSIVDLGFGSGYGCAILSNIKRSQVLGVDISPECQEYALQNYLRNNVDYTIEDLSSFIPKMNAFDYVVSRGVFEHVPDGLSLIESIQYDKRVLIDVPYNESPGNEHHILTGITERDFEGLENCEIFYEGLDGTIYPLESRPSDANMILIVQSSAQLPKISDLFEFPIPPVKDKAIENFDPNVACKTLTFKSPSALLDASAKYIKSTEVVLDLGCGLRPMSYFKPRLHILVEPFQEYFDMLTFQNEGDKSIMIIKSDALNTLCQLSQNAVDSIFLLDVIEHIPKEDGKNILNECERVAREQIVVFTPLGFMPQESYDHKDAWGLSGGQFQKHVSGWEPSDFNQGWTNLICEEFHQFDHDNEPFEKPYGAFFAIKNLTTKTISKPSTFKDINIPFYTAFDSQRLENENNILRQKLQELETINVNLQATNENLQVINGNLQATNENLQTTNKDIHLINQNLQTSYSALLNGPSIRLAQGLKRLLPLKLLKQLKIVV